MSGLAPSPPLRAVPQRHQLGGSGSCSLRLSARSPRRGGLRFLTVLSRRRDLENCAQLGCAERRAVQLVQGVKKRYEEQLREPGLFSLQVAEKPHHSLQLLGRRL